MSEYEDLLTGLQSNEPVKRPAARKEPAPRHYEITDSTPMREAYTREQIQGFLGFLVSFMTSLLLKTSTKITAGVLKGDTIPNRFEEYCTRSLNQGLEVADGTDEIVTVFDNIMKQSIETIIEDEDAKVEITMPFGLMRLIATTFTFYSLGRGFEATAVDARPNPIDLLTGAIEAAFDIPGEADELRERIKEALAEVLSKVEEEDLPRLVSDPEGWVKAKQAGEHDDEQA